MEKIPHPSVTQLTRVVTVSQGALQGQCIAIPLEDGRRILQVEQFLEVPYATAPVGEKRFQKPSTAEPWKGVMVTTVKPTRASPQLSGYKFEKDHTGEAVWRVGEEKNEDCLFVNIWCPNDALNNSQRAVMVWIFGGGFMTGSASMSYYNGAVMAALGDVIVVNINYRLGALGFMPVNCPEAPNRFVANQGLWDQCLALEWIRDNIAAFGGDPNNVCLFGESAGAACVGFHIVSPKCLGRGLFHKAILQSGFPWGESALTPSNVLLERAEILSHSISSQVDKHGQGCDENALQHITLDELIKMDLSISNDRNRFSPWTPCIDGDYIPQEPLEILKAGGFPLHSVIVGTNRDEATMLMLYEELEENMTLKQSNLSKLLAEWHATESNSTLFQSIVNHYSGPNASSVEEQVLLNSISDRYFHRPAVKFMEAIGQSIPSWIYHFAYRSYEHHPWPLWCGVMHGDEIRYIFGHPLKSSHGETHPDITMSHVMMELWTNFAKFGNPSTNVICWENALPRHKEASNHGLLYLQITNDKIFMEEMIERDRNIRFLDSCLH